MPWCDTPAMAAHLAEISAAVDPGAHAVLMLDQAGWHMTAKLAVPHNITLLPLPPRSPELNPVENVWQFIRDNWLSNRVFKSYDDIVALCCDAWNNLHRPTVENHVHRDAGMGPWVMISAGWYEQGGVSAARVDIQQCHRIRDQNRRTRRQRRARHLDRPIDRSRTGCTSRKTCRD